MAREDPKVSIVIPNYNGERFLPKCLDSLASQSFQDFELIVVDNGSEDGSLELLEKHRLKPQVLQLEKNLGFAQAVNLGMARASGELIALFNNDAFAEPDWLENLVRASDQYPEMDFFAPLIRRSEEREKIESAGIGYTLQGRVKPLWENETLARELKAQEVFLASATAVLIRKKLIEKIGGFDPDYFAYLEDVDFFLRARLNGGRGMLVPEAVVYHYGAGTELKDKPGQKRIESGERVFWIARNRWYLIWDNLPMSLILLLSPLIFFGWVRGLCYHFFCSHQIRAFLSGTRSGFFSFFKRKSKREKVRKLRRGSLIELLRWMSEGAWELK